VVHVLPSAEPVIKLKAPYRVVTRPVLVVTTTAPGSVVADRTGGVVTLAI